MSVFTEKESMELKTINDFLRFGFSLANEKELFFGHGTDNAWDDIWQLVLGSLYLPLDLDQHLLNARLTSKEKKHLLAQLEKRIHQRIPVPYLLQRAYFCGLSFYVDERVLIPRSPIAELIQEQFAPWIEAEKVDKILDLCTGSACIAIACAYAFPEAEIAAADISTKALEVAAINCRQHGLEDQIQLIASDCFNTITDRYDIIVSNPPYVGGEEMQTLPLEYGHEPVLALETGNNGLAIVETILHKAAAHLSEDGILVVEVGNSQDLLIDQFPDVPFTWLEFENGGQGVFVLSSLQLRDYFASR